MQATSVHEADASEPRRKGAQCPRYAGLRIPVPCSRSCSKETPPDGDEHCASLPSIPPSAPARPASSRPARHEPLARETIPMERGHAEALLPLIDRLVSPCGRRIREPEPGRRDGRAGQLYGSACRDRGRSRHRAGGRHSGRRGRHPVGFPRTDDGRRCARPVHQRHRRQARPHLHPGHRLWRQGHHRALADELSRCHSSARLGAAHDHRDRPPPCWRPKRGPRGSRLT